jgi:hypothetical protein
MVIFEDYIKIKSRNKNSTKFGRKGQHIKRKDIYELKHLNCFSNRYKEGQLRYACHVNTKYLKHYSHKTRRLHFRLEFLKYFYKNQIDDIISDPKPYGTPGCSSYWD